MRRGAEDQAAERSRALGALRDPGFLVLAAEFGLVTIAEWAFTTALAIQAFDVGGALAVGLAGARFLPAAAASVPLATLGDRFPPGWVLAGTAGARALLLGLAFAALGGDAPFGVLLAIAVVDAVLGTAYRPALARLIPALARTPADVAGAAALLANTKTVSQVVGALLASLLIASSGIELAVGVAAALYAVAAVGNAALAGRLHTRAAISAGGGESESDWLAGVRVVTEDAQVAHVAGLASLRSLGRGLWLALATLAALGFLDIGRAGVGVLIALSGIGVLLSLPVSAMLVARPYLRRPLTVALALCGAPLISIALAGSPSVAFAAAVVWGFGMAFADVILTSLQFRVVEAPVLSRATGAIESLKIGAEGAGALLAPALVAIAGLKPAIAIAGALPLVVVAAEQAPLRAVDRIASTRTSLLRLLHGVPLFASLGVEALERIAAGARRESHIAGADVIREGDRDARDFFVVEDGRVEVMLASWPVRELGRGEAFGERALLRGAPRSATVRTLTDVELQAIDRATFLAALTGTAREAELVRPRDADIGSLGEALRGLPLLADLEPGQLDELVAGGEVRRVSPGEVVIREGEPGAELFVILSGGMRVERDGQAVVELLPGDHVGEISLLHDVPRTATVRAINDTLVLAIGRGAYRAAIADATLTHA